MSKVEYVLYVHRLYSVIISTVNINTNNNTNLTISIAISNKYDSYF